MALDELKRNPPQTPEFAVALQDKPDPYHVRVFKRGNPSNQGDEAPRRFLLALSRPGVERPVWTKGSGRLELAQAIASPDNPLTARVWVNRVWLHHFGAGIVRTPSDFGRQGEKPTHPELLDYLASYFIANGWSTKKLHRLIVRSNAYRQSSEVSPAAFTADPENRLVSRMNRRRLDIEQMRDSLMLAAGKLDTKRVGGKSVDLWTPPFNERRAVYGFIERQNLPGIFRTFDFASPDTHAPQRFRTTVPQQALFFMNSPFAVEQARALTKRAEIEGAGNNAQRIRRLYRTLFGRMPDSEELALGLAFLGGPLAGKAGEAKKTETPIWQYGYGAYDSATQRVTGFTPLTHFSGEAYQASPNLPDPQLGYVLLNADGGHPGHDDQHSVIRRWTAPRDAELRITGTLAHKQAPGDGVRLRVVSNRIGLLADFSAHNNEVRLDRSVKVAAGETIDFVVSPQTGDAYDSFAFAPVLTEVLAKNGQIVTTTWNAKNQFKAPEAPVTALNRTERYAQALLMTNEFLFVD